MERRYLGATIAMAATFALFSHGFNSGLMGKLQERRTTLMSEARCAADTLRARVLDKVNRSLGGTSAEEAQLRVEFNLPSPVLAAPPVAPVAPKAPAVAPKQVSAPAAPPAVACRAQRVSAEVRLPRNFDRVVQASVNQAMRSQMLAVQTQLRSGQYLKAIANAQKAMANAQRQIALAAKAQARADKYQERGNSHPCPGTRSVRLTADDDTQDTDWGQLSREIQEEVSRSVEVNVRNF